jgi:CheY-like chemotaxis protein
MLALLAVGGGMHDLAGRQVLVVDDEVFVRFMVADLLEHAGCSVEEAEDGEQALGTLDSHQRFDLLVTDIRMPRLDGWSLAERARAIRPELPVLYVTGHSDVEARPVRGSIVLAKPFDPDQLMKAAARLLGS